MARKRRFFIVAWSNGIDFAMYVDCESTDTVQTWLKQLPAALNVTAEASDPKLEVLEAGKTCDLFGWDLELLPPDIRVNQIPNPGVVFAVRKGTRPEIIPEQSSTGEVVESDEENKEKSEDLERAFLFALKGELYGSKHAYSKRLKRFLESPEAQYVPVPLTKYDVFISYSSEDQLLATEIVTDLETSQMRTFMASRNLAAGNVWAEEIRQGLLESRVLLILLTPNSVTNYWVMCEVGASWALGKPLVPALLYVDPKTLPEVISSYQCKRIETVQGRKALVQELAKLCGVGSP